MLFRTQFRAGVNTIEDYVRELFNRSHWEIVDLGDVVEEEYEEGDF